MVSGGAHREPPASPASSCPHTDAETDTQRPRRPAPAAAHRAPIGLGPASRLPARGPSHQTLCKTRAQEGHFCPPGLGHPSALCWTQPSPDTPCPARPASMTASASLPRPAGGRGAVGRHSQDSLSCQEEVWTVPWLREVWTQALPCEWPARGCVVQKAGGRLLPPPRPALQLLCPSRAPRAPEMAPWASAGSFRPHCAEPRGWCRDNGDWPSRKGLPGLFRLGLRENEYCKPVDQARSPAAPGPRLLSAVTAPQHSSCHGNTP